MYDTISHTFIFEDDVFDVDIGRIQERVGRKDFDVSPLHGHGVVLAPFHLVIEVGDKVVFTVRLLKKKI